MVLQEPETKGDGDSVVVVGLNVCITRRTSGNTLLNIFVDFAIPSPFGKDVPPMSMPGVGLTIPQWDLSP